MDLKFSEILVIFPYIEGDNRSEEHTSELQSHVRISYAVFCLKKKNKTKEKMCKKKEHKRNTQTYSNEKNKQ